jgi:hypothetical protein
LAIIETELAIGGHSLEEVDGQDLDLHSLPGWHLVRKNEILLVDLYL